MWRPTLIALACTLAIAACSSPTTDETTTETSALTGCGASERVVPPSSRKVSFSSEVLPIFVASCAFGSCHGTPNGANNGVFLGVKSGANDAAAIRAALVARPSMQVASMPYVTPSSPSQSYLFRKLTGDFCSVAECAGNAGDSCGSPMPRGGDPLDAASLETVRSWILQGATAD